MRPSAPMLRTLRRRAVVSTTHQSSATRISCCCHRRLSTAASAASPFHRSLGVDAAQSLPQPVLDFHASGGLCAGGLLVQRGNLIGRIIATLGQLPKQTPDPLRDDPEDVVVRSRVDAAGDVVHWDRRFPQGVNIQSRWYFDEGSQLAVDSFTYLGIPDFAAFGFELVPVDANNRVVTAPPASAEAGAAADEEAAASEGGAIGSVRGFRHVTKKVWILGVPLPSALSITADGVSMAHEDGKGWLVKVAVVHPLFGLVVSYDGDVRLIADDAE